MRRRWLGIFVVMAAVAAVAVAIGSPALLRRPPPAVTARGARFGAEPPGTPRDGGTLRLHMEVEPPSLNPLVEHDAWTSWLTLGAIYDPLVRQDPVSGELRPALASAWELVDERTLRLTLREGVTWHDGQPFSADDVVATFDRLQDPSASPDARADFAALERVEKRSATEVVLHFARPAPLALQSLAFLAILPAHRFVAGDLRAQAASRAPVGTGPFRFVEWQPGQRIVLARAPRPWGPPAHVERVEVRIVRDREAALELARRGELDVLWQLSPSQVERAESDARLSSSRLVGFYLPRYVFVVWNTRRPGLADKRVRQALTMLVDHERWARLVYKGRARVVTGPFPTGSPSLDKNVIPRPFDPERARALLEAAGVRDSDGDGVREIDGKPLRLSFLALAGSPTTEQLATLMQEDFKRAGVLLDVEPTDWAAMLSRLRKHDFDLSSLQWVMRPVQDNYTLFHSSQAEAGQNYGAFKSPEVDRLLDEARATPMGPERERLDRALHHAVDEEQPYTFLGSPEVDSLVSARVRGYAPDAAGLGLADIWLDGAAP